MIKLEKLYKIEIVNLGNNLLKKKTILKNKNI